MEAAEKASWGLANIWFANLKEKLLNFKGWLCSPLFFQLFLLWG
jgi:hypothetical protein